MFCHDAAGFQSDTVSSNWGNAGPSGQAERPQGKFKQYVNSFGPETAREMARVVSQEAAKLIEMQTVALFGDYRLLQKQMEVCFPSNHREQLLTGEWHHVHSFKTVLNPLLRQRSCRAEIASQE